MNRLDLDKLRVYPLAQRRSLTTIEEILIDPNSSVPEAAAPHLPEIQRCANEIRAARKRGAAVILIYGAHLLRNGAALILERLMANKWVTHVATNGAGTIHDWEFAWHGRSTESVAENVLTGTFGTWDETGRNLHLALLAGSLKGEGYGQSLGRFIAEDGCHFPRIHELEQAIRQEILHPLTPARCDVLQMMHKFQIAEGHYALSHQWKKASILAQAHLYGVPCSVHPGIGYDIVATHPMFNGAVIGRAADLDFRILGASVDQLDQGVVLSIGSAIMGPQVFEKSLSCVNNLRLSAGRRIVQGHSIYVIDIQEGGGWNWNQGEPPKSNPAYYLRFCKSYSRMGGVMHYVNCDNLAFIHALHNELI